MKIIFNTTTQNLRQSTTILSNLVYIFMCVCVYSYNFHLTNIRCGVECTDSFINKILIVVLFYNNFLKFNNMNIPMSVNRLLQHDYKCIV